MNLSDYTYTATLQRKIQESIKAQQILPGLGHLCRVAGANYDEVVEHITAEVRLNNGQPAEDTVALVRKAV